MSASPAAWRGRGFQMRSDLTCKVPVFTVLEALEQSVLRSEENGGMSPEDIKHSFTLRHVTLFRKMADVLEKRLSESARKAE